jgi:hypothetical protein
MRQSPLSLTDSQLLVITNVCAQLRPRDRSLFLQKVARLLQGCEVGDGAVDRVVRLVLAEMEPQRAAWLAS